jgi:hypothetical protein
MFAVNQLTGFGSAEGPVYDFEVVYEDFWNDGTITFPYAPGYLAIWWGAAHSGTGTAPANNAPSGFTVAHTHSGVSGTGSRQSYGYKILTTGDTEQTVNALTAAEAADNVLLVLRPKGIITSILDTNNLASGPTTGDPAALTLAAPPSGPAIHLGACRTRGATPTTSGGLKNNGVNLWTNTRGAFYYEIQTTNLTSRTWDCNAPAAQCNHLTACTIYVT